MISYAYILALSLRTSKTIENQVCDLQKNKKTSNTGIFSKMAVVRLKIQRLCMPESKQNHIIDSKRNV